MHYLHEFRESTSSLPWVSGLLSGKVCAHRQHGAVHLQAHLNRKCDSCHALQAKDAEATIKALETELKALQEKHAAGNADLTSQIAALTSEKAGVERRLAAQVQLQSQVIIICGQSQNPDSGTRVLHTCYTFT